MSKIISELSTIVGTYTDKDGNKKNKYHRLGSIIDTPQGHMLKIDSIPVCDPPCLVGHGLILQKKEHLALIKRMMT